MTVLERDMLATLEEAGEGDLAALLNTVRECEGNSEELERYRNSLAALMQKGLVEFGMHRDEDSLSWISLPKPEATALLARLGSLLRWSDSDQLWTFCAPNPRVEVLLSDAGFVAAREILAQDGWPIRKAWSDVADER